MERRVWCVMSIINYRRFDAEWMGRSIERGGGISKPQFHARKGERLL
jgi:hypothetical protein